MRKKLLLTLTAFVMAIAMFSIISYAGKGPADTTGEPAVDKGIEINEKNFPDAVFRGEVAKEFDTNNNGFLSSEEIKNAKEIKLEGAYADTELRGLRLLKFLEKISVNSENVKFQYFFDFENLKTLNIEKSSIMGLELSGLKKLEDLNIKGDNITYINLVNTPKIKKLDLSNLKNLSQLHCSKNNFEKLDLSMNPNIKYLDCQENQNLKELVLGNSNKLETLNFSKTNIKDIDLSKCTNLGYINCSGNAIKTLDLKKNKELGALECQDNSLTTIDLSNNQKLRVLNCSNNPLGELDLSNNKKLKELYCSYAKLKKLDLKNFSYIEKLNCSNNEIKELDLSSMLNLSTLDCSNNELEKLDISKNTDLNDIKCNNNKLAFLNLSSSSPKVEAGENKHPIELKSDRTFELKKLPEGFDVDKASNWKGGTVKKGVLTVEEKANEVTYTYKMKEGKTETFTLKVVEPDFQLTRLGGENRIKTAIEVSKRFFTSSDRVFIARHDNFPDSLTAGVLAKAYDAPILLTETRSLNSDVKEEIKRLGAKYVTVIGGTDAISSRVVNELDAMSSVYSVERIAGENRFETAAKVAEKVVNRRGNPEKVIICTGTSFADSLSISSYAAKNGYPILLVGQNKVPKAVSAVMSKWKIGKVYILGGNLAVSSSVDYALPYKTERIGGTNRYETSKLIAEKFFSKDSEKCFIASGEDFPDALVVGAPAASVEAPIVLTQRSYLNLYTKLLLDGSKFKKVYMVGKYAAVSQNVENKVVELLKK